MKVSKQLKRSAPCATEMLQVTKLSIILSHLFFVVHLAENSPPATLARHNHCRSIFSGGAFHYFFWNISLELIGTTDRKKTGLSRCNYRMFQSQGLHPPALLLIRPVRAKRPVDFYFLLQLVLQLCFLNPTQTPPFLHTISRMILITFPHVCLSSRNKHPAMYATHSADQSFFLGQGRRRELLKLSKNQWLHPS